MVPDQPPMNRAARRAAAHNKTTKTIVLPQRAARPASRSRSAAPAQATGTGAASADEDDAMAETAEAPTPFASPFMSGGDAAPATRKAASHHKGGSKHQRVYEGLVSYYGFAGMLISTRQPMDGMVIVEQAEKMAQLHLDVGKANPSYMRVLELLTVAGPYTALVFGHAQLAFAIMGNHGMSPLSLFARAEQQAESAPEAAPPFAPLPYQPAGPQAPTDNAPVSPLWMPPAVEEGLKVYPDVGLPADFDIGLRELARKTGRPYEELLDAARLQMAQEQMKQNGHVVAPGALGAPVARE